ncbi:hypothetical protein RKD28_003294 [Streptomyces sp. SAI-229]
MVDGGGADASFEPVDDARGQSVHVPQGQGEAPVGAAQAGEEGDRLLVPPPRADGLARRVHGGGSGYGRLENLHRRVRNNRGDRNNRLTWGLVVLLGDLPATRALHRALSAGTTRPRAPGRPRGQRRVVGVRARHQTARLRVLAHPLQVAVRLQLPQRERDPVPPLGETLGETADVDRRALGHRQDVGRQPDRGQRQLAVLGEVVAHHHVLTGLVRAYVDDTGGCGGSSNTLNRERSRTRLLLSHGETLLPRWSGPRLGSASPGGGRCMYGLGGAPSCSGRSCAETARPNHHRASQFDAFHPLG